MIRPARLRAGSRVALVAPAGPIGEDRLHIALDRCTRFGLEAVPGRAVAGRHAGYLAGPDEQRLDDLQWGLSAEGLDAVWAIRGGYGTMRLLQHLDLSRWQARPRAFIGFSDSTAVHLALHARGVVSYHGPHAGGDSTPLAEAWMRRVLFDDAPAGVLPLPEPDGVRLICGGVAEGPLIGGNLALLAAMCGTAMAPVARGAILFVEEVSEPAYRIDRAWTQLLLSGALAGVAGIAFGRFTECGDEVGELLPRLALPLGVPAVAGLPIGHEPDNMTIPLGIRARLDGGRGTLELLEAAVS